MGIDAEMYAVTKTKLTPNEIVKLSYAAGLTFGAKHFCRDPKGWSYGEGKARQAFPPHHNISLVEEIEQDGPTWHAPKGYHIYKIHVWTRYYGPGYERGDFPFLFVLAAWLEHKLPGCQIMYGGDSSGVLAEPWGPAQRAEFMAHFASAHSRDYFKSFSTLERGAAPACDFCGGVPMAQQMFGGGIGNLRGGFVCHGCGRKVGRDEKGAFFECDPRSDDWKPKEK